MKSYSFLASALLLAMTGPKLAAGELSPSTFLGYDESWSAITIIPSPVEPMHFFTSSASVPGLVEWDARTGTVVRVLPRELLPAQFNRANLAPVYGSPLLLTGKGGGASLSLLDLQTMSARMLPGTGKLDPSVHWLTVDRHEDRIIGQKNRTIQVHDAATGKRLSSFDFPISYSFSGSGERVAFLDAGDVRVIDLAGKTRPIPCPPLANLGKLGLNANLAIMSPRGGFVVGRVQQKVVNALSDGRLTVVDLATGEEPDMPEISSDDSFSSRRALFFSPDDRFLLYATATEREEKDFVVFDLEHHRVVSRGSLDFIPTSQWTYFSGTHLISIVENPRKGRAAHFARVYDVRDNRFQLAKVFPLARPDPMDVAQRVAEMRTAAVERVHKQVADRARQAQPPEVRYPDFTPPFRELLNRVPVLTGRQRLSINRALLDRLGTEPWFGLYDTGLDPSAPRNQLAPPTLLNAPSYRLLPLGQVVADDGSVMLLTLGSYEYGPPSVRSRHIGQYTLYLHLLRPDHQRQGKPLDRERRQLDLDHGELGHEAELSIEVLEGSILMTIHRRDLSGVPTVVGHAFLKADGSGLF